MWKLLKLYICIFLIVADGGFATSEETIENEKGKSTPSPDNENHDLRRYDQEYQTCLENFDIHKDKIIRTQDSREMGAKYINEFDLSSRDECLRACCGTDTCDVFVFEEKNPGSCYLFHCGPPDDFKCKFTKHHNYTSAVLAPNRRLSELENQIKHTKHEQELAQLRKSDGAAQSTGTPYVSTTIVVPGSPKESLQLAAGTNVNSTTKQTGGLEGWLETETVTVVEQPAHRNLAVEAYRDNKSDLTVVPSDHRDRHCSVYQFECRGSGECIAIYNACDGIPQCADGSDEAPELGCPAQGTGTVITKHAGTNKETTVPPPPLAPTHPSVETKSVARVVPGADQTPMFSKYNSMKEDPLMGPINLQLSNQPNTPLEGQQGPPGYTYGGQGLQYQQQVAREWQPQLPQPPQPIPKPPAQEPRYPVQQNIAQNIGAQEKMFPPASNQQPPIKMYNMEGENQQNFNGPWTNYPHGSASQYQGPGNHQYEDGNSHIFSHKGNGLVADSDSPPNQMNDNNHNDFNAKFGGINGGNIYYNNVPYRPAQPPNTWKSNQQQVHDANPNPNMGAIQHNDNSHKMMLPPDYYYEDNQSAGGRDIRIHSLGIHQEFHQEARPYPHQPSQKSSANLPPYQARMEQQSQQNIAPSLESKMEQNQVFVPEQKKDTTEIHVKPEKSVHHHNHEVTTAAPESRTKPKEKVKKRVDVKEKAEGQMSEEETMIIEVMDGEAPKPAGAILSLALGLSITGILLTLVGCRIQGIRKRLRRGSKSPYTHDADYLVNGMYL